MGKAVDKKPDNAPTPKPKLKYKDNAFYLDYAPDYELGIRDLVYDIVLDDGVNDPVTRHYY